MNTNEVKIFSNDNGYIAENDTEGYIRIMVKSMRNFDGFIEPYYNETRINYKTGLFQSWTATGYSADYIEQYKNRDEAISRGETMLKKKCA